MFMKRVRNLIWRVKRVFIVKFIMAVLERFGRDNVGLIAAGLAFFTVLTLVPLLLTAIAGVGYWLDLTHRTSMDAVAIIQKYLTDNVLPGKAGAEVTHLMERANVGETVHKMKESKGIAGIIGLLGIVWAALQIYVSGSTAMNAAWETKETRNWVKLRLVCLGLFVATGLLLVASLVATAVGSWFSRHMIFPGAALMVTVGTEIGAVVLSTIMYTLVYRFLPAGQPSWRSAFVGGLFSAIAWEVAKKGVAVFLLRPNHSLYGGLADLIIFVLWIYYSMMILLAGAEVGSTYTAEVVNHRRTVLKRTGLATPASDTAVGTSALARRKQKIRGQSKRKIPEDTKMSAERG